MMGYLVSNTAQAKENKPITIPQASQRSPAQNYKDMVLVSCIARADRSGSEASKDANYSANAYLEWTLYDIEKSRESINFLIETYLKRDYKNPLVEYKGINFNLLKCLDLYHSKELAAQVKQFVLKSNKKI
jgi:hypothetical protein